MQELIWNQLAALAFSEEDKVLLAEHKHTFAADNDELVS